MPDLTALARAARDAFDSGPHVQLWEQLPQVTRDRWLRAAAAVLAAKTELSTPVDGRVGGQRHGGRGTADVAMQLAVPRAGTQRGRMLDHLCHPDQLQAGATDVELQIELGIPANSVRPRRVELCDAGWVADTGLRRKHHGRDHVVWGLTPAAIEKLTETGEPAA